MTVSTNILIGLGCRVSGPTLIVTGETLTFDWPWEHSDKFRENCDVILGDVLQASLASMTYRDQTVTTNCKHTT